MDSNDGHVHSPRMGILFSILVILIASEGPFACGRFHTAALDGEFARDIQFRPNGASGKGGSM
ncbi:MAG: hypothetical protein O2857_25470 [Planctomycetota bacterium]|nr:hypothetical protein [Planctomycetota bacterium]